MEEQSIDTLKNGLAKSASSLVDQVERRSPTAKTRTAMTTPTIPLGGMAVSRCRESSISK